MIKVIGCVFFSCLFSQGGVWGADSRSMKSSEAHENTQYSSVQSELEKKRIEERIQEENKQVEERIQGEKNAWRTRIKACPFDKTSSMVGRKRIAFNDKLIKQADQDGVILSRFCKDSVGVSANEIRRISAVYKPSFFPMAQSAWKSRDADPAIGFYIIFGLFSLDAIIATPLYSISHGSKWLGMKLGTRKSIKNQLYEALLMVQLDKEDSQNGESVFNFLLRQAEGKGCREMVEMRLKFLKQEHCLQHLYWEGLCWLLEMEAEKWESFQSSFKGFRSDLYKISYLSLYIKKRGELTAENIKYLGK